MQNLLEGLLINIRDDGLSLHSLLQPGEEHGPEDPGPGPENGLVDLETLVARVKSAVSGSSMSFAMSSMKTLVPAFKGILLVLSFKK